MDDNFDSVIEQMELDELSDAPLLSPRDFAKLIGVTPQLVYYHLRAKHIEDVTCNCGRRCVDVKKARAFFASKGKKEVNVDPD